MELEHPALLWGLSGLCLFAYASWRSHRRTGRWYRAFTGVPRPARGAALRVLLLSAALGVLLVSRAGPRVQVEKRVLNRSGIDLAVGIDISKSMLARDEELPDDFREVFPLPNRLNRARAFALDLLSELQGERIAVYAFASQSVELIPFTQDYGYAKYLIRHVSDTDLTASGSDLGEAVGTAIELLAQGEKGSLKRLVLLSDGEDISTDRSTLYEAAQLAGSRGIKICAIGIGSERPVPIPVHGPREEAATETYLDEDGSMLRTSLEREPLERIAHLSGGRFLRIGEEEANPHRVVQWILADAGGSQATQGVELAWVDLAPAFLLTGIAFAVAGIMVRS